MGGGVVGTDGHVAVTTTVGCLCHINLIAGQGFPKNLLRYRLGRGNVCFYDLTLYEKSHFSLEVVTIDFSSRGSSKNPTSPKSSPAFIVQELTTQGHH